jgi:RNA polymerase sigma factor (sigma-70 family)
MPPPAEGFAARLVLGPALRTQPDRRLVSLVREGYETAFEEIVRRYGKPLTRYAGAIVGAHAEDVTQDAFSKALLALRCDGAEIELRPWLFRIVRNTALNDLRDSPPSAEALAGEIAGGGSPAEALERREELADLMRRLRSLPEPQRAAIVMRELEGLSHEEIAAALGLSGGAARQAIYRARQALRDGLGMLLPLPLLRMLIDHGGEAAAGAGVGGAVTASGALGGAGASMALKAGVVTAVLAGSVGAGVALHDRGHARADAAAAGSAQTAAITPETALQTAFSSSSSSSPPSTSGGNGERGDDSNGGDGRGNSGSRSGDDGARSGHGDSGRSGPLHTVIPSKSGPRRDHSEPSDDHGGSRGAREPGGENHGGGEDRHSGPGPRSPAGDDSGGHTGSGNEGRDEDGGGSGDFLPPPPPEEEREEARKGDGDSGAGSGDLEVGMESPSGSGSGSGTSGSGGSGEELP